MAVQEIWKDIENYEELYQVSNYGKIKSLPKTWFTGISYITRKERILKQTLDTKGYLKVTLANKKVHKTLRVHRLIAEAFIPNPLNKKLINHKNGNKKDNRIENLEWVTHQENCQHAQDTFLNTSRFSEKQKEAIRKTGLRNKGRVRKAVA